MVPPPTPRPPGISPSLSARVIHLALVVGMVLFWAVAWLLGRYYSLPTELLPDRRVLYLALFVVSAVFFGAAGFTASRLGGRAGGAPDEWWRRNLGRVLLVWALLECPALLGIVAYLLTHDFRTLLATLAGLVLFLAYSPDRLAERP